MSSGEIAPDFDAKGVIVAYERDGKPLDEFRIVMPGDKHGGRNVRKRTANSAHLALQGSGRGGVHRGDRCRGCGRI